MEHLKLGLRVPYDLDAWLTQKARKQRIAKNALIVQILWDWAEHQEQETDKYLR